MLGRQSGAQEVARRGIKKTGSTQKVENVASVIEAGMTLTMHGRVVPDGNPLSNQHGAKMC